MIRFPLEDPADVVELVVAEPEGSMDGWGFWGTGHRRILPVVDFTSHPFEFISLYDWHMPSDGGGIAPMGDTTKKPMSDDHKAALATGRNLGRSVKTYLEALENNRPKRGRRRTSESITKRLDVIGQEIDSADPVRRVSLIQERINLTNEVEQMGQRVDMSALENEFVSVAKGYSTSKGISYAAWREAGVAADVLKRAGISRTAS